MVPSGSKKTVITALMDRLGAMLRTFEAFSDEEVIELLDVLADDLKNQRPSAYVLTDRVVGVSQRGVPLRLGIGDGKPRVWLFNGLSDTLWGAFPKDFGEKEYEVGQIVRLDSAGLVAFLRDHGHVPEVAYAQMIDNAVHVMSARVADYNERLAGLHAMMANIRIHQAKSAMLSNIRKPRVPADS